MSDSETSMLLPQRKLSLYQKFSYSVGHVLNDLTASMWFTYMIIYFHQVKNFDNGLSGDLVLIGQISDAIFTPFIGYESDRVRGCGNMGKRKTWHFIGSVCVLLSFPFLFIGCIMCDNAPDVPQFIYYVPFVVIFQFGWAAVQINHLSLIPDLTDNEHERTGLNGSRYACTVLSNMVVYSIAWAIFELKRSDSTSTDLTFDDHDKFKLLVLIVVGVGLVFSVIFHVGVKESPHPCHEDEPTNAESQDLNSLEKSTLRKLAMTWTCWLKEHQFYQVAVIYMATRLVVNLSQVYLPMYITETMKMDKQSIAIVPLIVYVSGFVTSLAMEHVNRLAGRKMTYMLGIGFCLGASVTFYLLPEGSVFVYLAAVLSGIGGSTILVTSLAMTSDLIKDNTESGAFVYGAMSFTDKLSNGAAIAIIQQLHPCPVGCCPLCKEYYRQIMTFVPAGCAILAFIVLLTLLPQKLGMRRKQARILQPVLAGQTSRYGSHDSVETTRTNSLLVNGTIVEDREESSEDLDSGSNESEPKYATCNGLISDHPTIR